VSDVRHAGTTTAAIATFAWQHPGQFATRFAAAATNWEEWKKNPARAMGEMIPQIVLAVVTAGIGEGADVLVATSEDLDLMAGTLELVSITAPTAEEADLWAIGAVAARSESARLAATAERTKKVLDVKEAIENAENLQAVGGALGGDDQTVAQDEAGQKIGTKIGEHIFHVP
jgi:hypothetical protein